ncbi:MAG: hypothetical protein DI623_01745 [Sphingomonas sanxanigenens]|uniref:HTH merR-type domain-containing protein n=1 Tax=Sphingomonas sanxanigenens TaxID=397260 RepID=A0A2W5CBS9_9SPHN|nr:MAG: hypothetical protein DI623_01745 [Sphingomonas sanxanigenens]
MSKLDTMKNLRAGVIYGAARIAPTTARTWGLELGETRVGGYPRYSVADAVALVIMSELTHGMSMAAAPARIIVNSLRPLLPELIEKVVVEQESTGKWRWEGGPFAIVTGSPGKSGSRPPSTWLKVVDGNDVGSIIADRNAGLTPLILSLQRLINQGIYRLERVLAGELGAYEDDAGA